MAKYNVPENSLKQQQKKKAFPVILPDCSKISKYRGSQKAWLLAALHTDVTLFCPHSMYVCKGEFHGKIVRTVGIVYGKSNFWAITPSEWRLGKIFKRFF